MSAHPTRFEARQWLARARLAPHGPYRRSCLAHARWHLTTPGDPR